MTIRFVSPALAGFTGLRAGVLAGMLFAVTTLTPPTSLDAQIRGSERSVVSQMSDGTKVTIDYARPHVRGRVPVFGGWVAWDHVWTPGANEATTFEVDKDITLNGVSVPAGRYSVWIDLEEGDWEFILDPDTELYHTQPPEESPEQIRFWVTPEEAEFTEALTWEFPVVKRTGMALRFRWADMSVPFEIEVEPTRVLTVDAEQAAALVGQYMVTFEGPPPPGAPPGAEMPPMPFEVRYDGEHLVGVMAGGPPGAPSEAALLPVADLVFNPAWLMDGEIFEVEVDMYFEFNVEDGQATGFDVRGLEDRLMMRGRRTG